MNELKLLIEKVKEGKSINLTEKTVQHFSDLLKADITIFSELEEGIKDFEVRMKIEGMLRMLLLNIYPKTIEEYVNENKLNKSDFLGDLFWLNEEESEMVHQIEIKLEGKVYHCIKSGNTFFDILYVTKYIEEWEMDRNDLLGNYALSYCINLKDDICSELGGIYIQTLNGGIIRTA